MSNLAICGGKAVRSQRFTKWPIVTDSQRQALLEVYDSGQWGRSTEGFINRFEKAFSKTIDTDECIAVTNGTAALEVALRACGISGGDEVLLPAYTFVATATSVLMNAAIPIFVDIDPDTLCLDPREIEKNITEHTKAIIPVHLGGNVCDMEKIIQISHKYNLKIVEDACQAHLAEWKEKRVGSFGDLGCFSFQSSKNMTSGEGGAIVGPSGKTIERCFSIQTCGREKGRAWYFHPHLGTNCRMTEFQAAILLTQLHQAEKFTSIREKNAQYLTERLADINGLTTAKKYSSTTRHAYHIFIIQYDKDAFDGLKRDKFIEALLKEGIPCQPGYTPLYKEGYLKETFQTPTFKKIYEEKYLQTYFDRISCPQTEKKCYDQSIWLPQQLLLGSKEDMDDVINAFEKIATNYRELLI